MKKQLFEIVKNLLPVVKDTSTAFRVIVQGAVSVNGIRQINPFIDVDEADKCVITIRQKRIPCSWPVNETG